MKLAPREIENFLSAPPKACRLFLFYGPDQGLVRQRAKQMAQRSAVDLNDPFSVTILEGDALAKDPARLVAEAAMLALGAAERVIWLRDTDEKCVKSIEALLLSDAIPALVVMEAGDLAPKSALRKLVEAAPHSAAAIPCYVEDAGQVAQYAVRELAQAGWRLTRDAAAWFGQHQSGNRGLAQQEIEKLITYLGAPRAGNNEAGLETLQAVAAGGAAMVEDAFIDAIGTSAALDMLQKLLAEGAAVVNLIRALGRHAARLYAVQLKTKAGEDIKSAMDHLQPKVFFKRENAFRAQLSRFSLRTLARLRTELWRLEAACKQTGAADELLLAQLVLRLGMGTPKQG